MNYHLTHALQQEKRNRKMSRRSALCASSPAWPFARCCSLCRTDSTGNSMRRPTFAAIGPCFILCHVGLHYMAEHPTENEYRRGNENGDYSRDDRVTSGAQRLPLPSAVNATEFRVESVRAKLDSGVGRYTYTEYEGDVADHKSQSRMPSLIMRDVSVRNRGFRTLVLGAKLPYQLPGRDVSPAFAEKGALRSVRDEH